MPIVTKISESEPAAPLISVGATSFIYLGQNTEKNPADRP